MLVIAIAATVLAFMQNMLMFLLGMKEMAISSSPLSFVRIFLGEIALIWTGYFAIRRIVRGRRALVLTAWTVVVLGAAEPMLPVSYFTIMIQHAKRKQVLDQIEQSAGTIEALSSDRGSTRFALTYVLRFPKTGHYLTFPAYIGSKDNRVFGNYFMKIHPEYYDENYVFDAGKLYSFTVVFDTEGKSFNFSRERADIDICDGKDYFMACRIIEMGLEDVPQAFTTLPLPNRSEPEVPVGNIRDLTEKSIRLDGLALMSSTAKVGGPIEFSFEIKNVGKEQVLIPGSDFGNVIGVNYGWEAVSDTAKKTTVSPGMARLGSAVAAGSAQFTFIRKSALTPGDTVIVADKIAPFEPLAPGEYKLHLFLFSRYATELNKPEQELTQAFSVVP
jgi:hypothetical protein